MIFALITIVAYIYPLIDNRPLLTELVVNPIIQEYGFEMINNKTSDETGFLSQIREFINQKKHGIHPIKNDIFNSFELKVNKAYKN